MLELLVVEQSMGKFMEQGDPTVTIRIFIVVNSFCAWRPVEVIARDESYLWKIGLKPSDE